MRNKREGQGKWWLLLFAVSMVLAFYSPAYAATAKADMAFINGKVLTVDKNFSVKEAIAVKGDRIMLVGTNRKIQAHIGKNTQVIDLEGKTILPGINDSHAHVMSYGTVTLSSLDVGYPVVENIPEIQAVLAARVAEVPEGQWIRGRGFDPAYIAECEGIEYNECLNKGQLDAVSPNNPVVFTSWCGHNMWVNSMALELAGIDASTPDPDGGVIIRDEDGNPTGFLLEKAKNLVSAILPPYTDGEYREGIVKGIAEMNKNGITSYTEPGATPERINNYKEVYDQGKLNARVSVMMTLGSDYESLKNGLETYNWPSGCDPKWLRCGGIKIFADGVPMSETSWMWDPYVSGAYGSLVIPGVTDEEKVEELTKMIIYSHSQGFQVGIHATGDRTITTCVDAYEAAYKQYSWIKPRRHYIIHGDFTRPEDCWRLARMGWGINMQPYIQTLIADIDAIVLGPERTAYEWPFRTALDAGIPLTFSSDTSVTYPNWRRGVQSAITRENMSGTRVSGPDQIISREEAIRAYTINGAWQDFMENKKGSIEARKLADFCVLDQDIMTAEAHTLGNINVVMTIVGGKIVYDASVPE